MDGPDLQRHRRHAQCAAQGGRGLRSPRGLGSLLRERTQAGKSERSGARGLGVKTASMRDFVEVKRRFHRSVRLNRDWEERGDLGDYLFTPTARELATRMMSALEEPGGLRACSVTGPYGSGKSAFALFLTDLLAHDLPQHPETGNHKWRRGLRSNPRSPQNPSRKQRRKVGGHSQRVRREPDEGRLRAHEQEGPKL